MTRPATLPTGAPAPVTRELLLALAAVLAADELEHLLDGDDDAAGLEDAADYLAATCGPAALYPVAFAELFAAVHYPLIPGEPDWAAASTLEQRAEYVPTLAARIRPVIAQHRDFYARQGRLALVFR